MNIKKIGSVLAALVFGVCVSSFALATDKGPEVMKLEAKKGVVTFKHREHQKRTECGECHHGPDHSVYKEGMKIQKCAECHKKDFKNKKLNKPMKAFHKNCKGCHKQMKKGPVKCKECHKK